MCAILDNDCVGDVFSGSVDTAAAQFFDWMNTRRCRLVVGGQLRRELMKTQAFQVWARTAFQDGRLRRENDDAVDQLAAELVESGACVSDDPHTIALAQISGARLLYSKDEDLRRDFRNVDLLRPRGRLLPLGDSKNARQIRKRMLNGPDLCPTRKLSHLRAQPPPVR